MRLWSVRHAALLERVYDAFEAMLVAAAPLLARIGYDRLERPFAFVERHVKGALFDCRMCGDCVLSSTGMSCPMNCPKALRNGPCGGVRANGNCEVYPQMPCVWVKAYEGSRRMREAAANRRRPAADRPRLKGSSAWLRAGAPAQRRRGRMTTSAPHPHDIGPDPGAPLVDLPGHSSRGRLERVLGAASSPSPPNSIRPIRRTRRTSTTRAQIFEGWVDGINATDGSGAHCHMSSVAICALLTRIGYSPVMQISCRDYNRIAIQGNVLGAAALQVGNILCLTGDGVQCGDQPEAKPVFDLDSISLLSVIRRMRDEGNVSFRAQDHDAAARLHRRRGEPLRAALRFSRRPARQEDRRGRAVRADPILLRSAPAAAVHGEGARHGARREVLHAGRRRAARLGEGRALDARQCRGRPYPRRRRRAARRRQ